MYLCRFVNIETSVRVHTYRPVYIYIHTYIHTHTLSPGCIHICTCMCACIPVSLSRSLCIHPPFYTSIYYYNESIEPSI